MATITLEYTKLNKSLQVGDYMFHSGLTNNGSYEIGDSGNNQLGVVKAITKPIVEVVKNVDIQQSSINRDSTWIARHYPSNELNELVVLPSDNSSTVLSLTEVLVGDIIAVTDSSNITTSHTVTNTHVSNVPITIVSITPDLLDAPGITYYTVDIVDVGTGRVYMNYTGDIEVGDTVTGPNLSAAPTIVSSIVANEYVVLNPTPAIKGVVDLTFTATTDSYKNNYHVTVEVDLGATYPDSSSYFYFVKDSRANKAGLKGYYAEVKMTNSDTTKKTELFSIGSEIVESSK